MLASLASCGLGDEGRARFLTFRGLTSAGGERMLLLSKSGAAGGFVAARIFCLNSAALTVLPDDGSVPEPLRLGRL